MSAGEPMRRTYRRIGSHRLCEVVQAWVVGLYPGWASQREFGLEAESVRSIERALREVEG